MNQISRVRGVRSWLYFLVLLLVLSQSVLGQELHSAVPEEVGLSSERLERIGKVMREYIDQKQVAGVVTLISRRGKVAHLGAFGMMDIEDNKPMRTDTIFRIASMTKAITSVAVMMLYEEGHFLLSDPISKYIPEFKNPKVLVSESDEEANTDSPATIPAKGEIRIRHLLNHTSGITYNWNQKLGKLYKDAGVSNGLIQTEGTIGENVKILAGLPLLNHPGEVFEYSLSLDVLGYLVEVLSGMTLDEFFHKRIFEPLGMMDTHFFVPDDKVSRLAAVYKRTEEGHLERFSEEPVAINDTAFFSVSYPYQGPRTYFSGGAGLCSTISDYAKFLQMMLNGGELDGVRLLGRKTVELMTTNSIKDLGNPNFKFGLGFGIRTELGNYGEIESNGTYSWSGFFYTNFWVDPMEDMICIFMCQRFDTGAKDLHDKFRILAYQSIVD